MIIPVVIIFVVASINEYFPIGSELLNSYDSFTQYPGMLLEYTKLLRTGNVFYSWGAGLGFNFFGTLTYYCLSPLNLLALFANSQNYHVFITIMTYLRFALLGCSMCFYLSHKSIKPIRIVLFSVIYALMGYTSTYYYNYIWIDSIIMLPLVIHGLDELIRGKSPTFYIVSLVITIFINYYIGYMICIFCLIWFLYNLVNLQNRKQIIKVFLTSSILSGLACAIVIVPSFFSLMTGKATLFEKIDYLGFSNNASTFFYTLLPGSYQAGNQIDGPALIYTSILVLVLCIFYFFNRRFSKKQKIATFLVILLYYLSFSINFLNYAWQFFQKPIWWQSRFSFTFSFFLITVASRTLENIDKTDFNVKHRILFATFLILGVLTGAYIKLTAMNKVEVYTYIYLAFSIILIIEMFALVDKRSFFVMVTIFTLVEVSLNAYNSFKNNYRYKSYSDYAYIREEVPNMLEHLNEMNDNFYRMEFIDDYTSDDGLYFGFNGLNYFNSVRNIKVIEFLDKLGIKVYDKCHVQLDDFDPILLSLLNIKYLYGDAIDYYKEIDNNFFEHPHPLGLGFASKSDIVDVELKDESEYINRQNIVEAMTGLDLDIYEFIDRGKFSKDTDDIYTIYTYTFESKAKYLALPQFSGTITIDNYTEPFKNKPIEIPSGSKVSITYKIAGQVDEIDVCAVLLNIDNYNLQMNSLEGNIMFSKTNSNRHILEGRITIPNGYDYLYTSIEYEEGMIIYVDGKEVEPDVILGALIGVSLEEGEHEIVIDYIPKGFLSGGIISVLSLLSICFYLQKKKKVL